VCNGADEGVVVVGCCVRKREVGEGVWAKRSKPSHHGLISGAPYETAKGDGAEGWCGGVYEVAVEVGLCTCKTRGREGGFGPKPETELMWLGLGRTM